MYLSTNDDLEHKGFGQPISRSRGQRDRRVSLMLLTTLAVAIMVSAATLRLDDGGPVGGGQSSAWNILRGPMANLTNGG